MSYPSFFFNDTSTTSLYTLSLHDALPISRPLRDQAASLEGRRRHVGDQSPAVGGSAARTMVRRRGRSARHPLDLRRDRKSTRLNSSHGYISYAVFCLKKKKK